MCARFQTAPTGERNWEPRLPVGRRCKPRPAGGEIPSVRSCVRGFKPRLPVGGNCKLRLPVGRNCEPRPTVGKIPRVRSCVRGFKPRLPGRGIVNRAYRWESVVTRAYPVGGSCKLRLPVGRS